MRFTINLAAWIAIYLQAFIVVCIIPLFTFEYNTAADFAAHLIGIGNRLAAIQFGFTTNTWRIKLTSIAAICILLQVVSKLTVFHLALALTANTISPSINDIRAIMNFTILRTAECQAVVRVNADSVTGCRGIVGASLTA